MTVTYKPTATLTIANGEHTSDSIALSNRYGCIGFVSPAIVDGAAGSPPGAVHLRVLGSVDGTNFFPVYNRDDNNPATVPLGQSEARILPLDPVFTALCSHIKVQIVDGTFVAGVSQTADRVFTAVLYEV